MSPLDASLVIQGIEGDMQRAINFLSSTNTINYWPLRLFKPLTGNRVTIACKIVSHPILLALAKEDV